MKNIFYKLVCIVGFVAGINIIAQATTKSTSPKPFMTSGATISYLVPTEEHNKYCNGNALDEKGFRKTITRLVTKPLPRQNLSHEELIKETVILASKDTRLTKIIRNNKNFMRIKGDTIYMEPIDGWAGVSIFMCAWRPIVEINVLHFPEIKKVVWVSDVF
jgi:hypothetical protein